MEDLIRWVHSLPPITRIWLGTSFGITALVTTDFLRPHDLLFDLYSIKERMQLWRIVTSFCYCGGTLRDFDALIILYLIWNHSKSYELNPFTAGGGRVADAAFAYLFCMLVILGSYPLLNEYGPKFLPARHSHPVLYPFFTRTLVYAIMYLWSRRNPNARIQLNFIPVRGEYLPFAYIGFSVALGNRLNEMLHGLIVGHLFYYCVDVVPAILGRRVLTTPRFIVELLGGAQGGAADYVVVEDFYDSDEDVGLPPPPPSPRAERERREQQYRHEDGATDAHIAAKSGSLQALRVMVRVDGEQILNATDDNSWTPLHEAVRGGHLDVINYLLEQGVDVNARTQNDEGFSPLWLAQATHGPDHEVTRRLREAGAVEIDPEY